MDYNNKFGFRADERKQVETRTIVGKLGVIKKANGSAYVEQGKTKVLIGIYGPQEIKGKIQPGKMLINCQCSMGPYSLPDKKCETNHAEFARILKQVFESSIMPQCYTNSHIDIFLEFLELDGSALASGINGTTLALVDAGIKLKGLVCSSSCGGVQGKALVDLNNLEEQQISFKLTVAMLPSVYNQILMHNLKGKLHESQFDEATEMAAKACKDVLNNLNEICIESFKQYEE